MYTGNQIQKGHEDARREMRAWKKDMRKNVYEENIDFQHTLSLYFKKSDLERIEKGLSKFGMTVATTLEDVVTENDHRLNYPRVENYNGIGDVDNKIVHHPTLAQAGQLIFETGIVEKLASLGGLKEGHAFYFLSNHPGEAGHNCPLICSYETTRLLRKLPNFKNKDYYIKRLLDKNYKTAYTSSQFLTEVQGGSDVGKNATLAYQDEAGNWRIRGEKWFTSNANAELNVITARYDSNKSGTKGLAVFLVPSHLEDSSRNTYSFRRIKEKIGTRALATCEIDYHDALAYSLGPVEQGFYTLMNEVIHHSRLALGLSVLGVSTSAYRTARLYANHRSAFGNKIINYPLVQENLAQMRCKILTGLAGSYRLIDIQDKIDLGFYEGDKMKAFIRLMSNISKHLISQWAVDICHHAIDGLGGNGAIETFSSLPRLLRDVIVEENWEGSHNTLRMQVLRDIHKLQLEEIYMEVVKEEISQFSEPNYKQIFKSYLNQLQRQVADLKVAPQHLQTLKIQDVIKLMGNLYYYISLVREGLHLEQQGKDNTKLNAAKLFKLNHLDRETPDWDDAYLAMIQSVIRKEEDKNENFIKTPLVSKVSSK